MSLGRSRDCEGEAGASGCRAGAGGAAADRPMWPHLLPSVSSSLRPLLSSKHASPFESLPAVSAASLYFLTAGRRGQCRSPQNTFGLPKLLTANCICTLCHHLVAEVSNGDLAAGHSKVT